MVLLLGDLDGLVPSVQLLIHSHGFFNLIMLDKDGFSLVELLLEHSELGLNPEVLDAFLSNEFVDLPEVVSLRDVSKSGIASFSNIKILLLDGHLGNSLPVGFCLWSELEGLKDFDCSVKALVLESGTELDEGLIQVVADSVLSVLNKDLSLALRSLDGIDITLDLVHGDLVGLFDTVPHTEVVSVLSNNHIGVWDPADILAVIEQSLLLLLLDVVEMQLSPLVSEQQLVASWVQLEVVDLAVVIDGRLDLVVSEVLDADPLLPVLVVLLGGDVALVVSLDGLLIVLVAATLGHLVIKEIGNDLGWLTASQLLL